MFKLTQMLSGGRRIKPLEVVRMSPKGKEVDIWAKDCTPLLAQQRFAPGF